MLATNGRYVRAPNGEVLFTLRRTNSKELGIIYYATQGEKEFGGVIKDPLLVERITTYWTSHFGESMTNCSAFASFLATGRFVPYEMGAIITPGFMRPPDPRTKIQVGDVVALLFLDPKTSRSRKRHWRKVFVDTQRKRSQSLGFKHHMVIDDDGDAFSPEKLQKLIRDPVIVDYHFMVCVDHHEGRPVWLSQCGWSEPGDERGRDFVVTKGWYDPYPELAHGPMLICRRK